MNILLIEDDPKVQRGTKMLLRRALGDSIAIDVAGSALAAVDYLAQCPFDVVLSDFDLGPGGNGGQVLIWLRANKPEMIERFIFFSGSSEVERLHHKVIEKGIWSDEFSEQLLRHLEGLVAA